MPDIYTTTTDLEAVNSMLATVGETPINTLSGSLTANVQIAVDLLKKTSRQVQLEGWHFNTEEDYLLALDTGGKIPIPGNTLDIDLTTEDGTVDIVQRGLFLYDRLNHTFVFSQAQSCTIIFFLPWTDLNEPAKNYIMVKAARIYQDQTVGSSQHHQFTAADEMLAYSNFLSSDTRNSDYSIFDTIDISSIVNRRRPLTSQFPT